MRSYVADYEMKQIDSLEGTLSLMHSDPGKWKVFAGGTDLMVQFEMGHLAHKNFLDISNFYELKKIEIENEPGPGKVLSIGSLCTYSQIQQCPEVNVYFPILAQASFLTGAVAIQNRGTIGGNIANASPAADSLPALLVYDAEIVLRSSAGRRRMNYKDFHKEYKKIDLRSEEIIESVKLPLRTQEPALSTTAVTGLLGSPLNCHLYKKVGTRAFQSIAKVSVAIAAQVQDGQVNYLKAGYSSVAPVPLLFKELESEYLNKNVSTFSRSRLKDLVMSFFHPRDDIRSSAEYRRLVVENLTWDFLSKIQENPRGILHLER